MKTITITVSTDGKTLVETSGFTGESCREATRLLEEALGKPTSEQLKPEFHMSTAEQQRLQEGA